MKKWGIIVLIFFVGNKISAQNGYSNIIDLYENSSDIFFSLLNIEDDVYVSIGNRCANFTTDCSALGKINVKTGALEWTERTEWLDPGIRSIDQRETLIEMSGHDYWDQSRFFLHRRTFEGDSISTFELLPPSDISEVAIGGNFTYGSHTLVFGNCVREITGDIPGLIFWVNSSGQIDSTMLIESGTEVNTIRDMEVDPDGLLTVLVEFEEIIGGNYPYEIRRKQLLKFNEKMELIWQWQTDDGTNFDEMTHGRFAILEDGTIVMPGEGNSSFAEEIWGIDQNGIKWKYKFPLGGSNIFKTFNLTTAQNGDVIGCGQIADADVIDGFHGYLFRLSAEGELIWDRAIVDNNNTAPSPANSSLFLDVKELGDGTIVTVGRQNVWYYNDLNEVTLGLDAWIVRTDAEGCIIENCGYVQDLVTSVPIISNTSKIKIYPNPASNFLHIKIDGDKRIETIQLINSVGQFVMSWDASNYSRTLDVSEIPRGIYIVKMKDKKGTSYTEKIILL